METLQADEWCANSLHEWEEAVENYTSLMKSPKTEEESALLRSARIKRAEIKMATAVTKADVAMLIQQLMKDGPRGVVTIEVPEQQLYVRLAWNVIKNEGL